ncbi:MAG: hypothetical protein KatS3mg108_2415 [Isosphaeraceae bacterium]|nr:MAG: hypothetical protein KatS3mg108_2415 [Isosphaeraceae bacterium]
MSRADGTLRRISSLCRSILVLLGVLATASCASPEDGRPRGGGAGADGGNYPAKPIPVPSKITGTRALVVGDSP